ncbi:MAG: hypothetical protein K1X91_14110 [Bacteriodetes bacterium]|nr:hypothetical protein [Bacteroidota bacterium]
MKVRFFLRSKQVERSEIMLVVRHGTAGLNIRELRIQTGLHCKPNQWNVVQDKFNKKDRQRYNTIGCKQINAKLDVIEVKVHELIREARSLDIDLWLILEAISIQQMYWKASTLPLKLKSRS